MLQQDEPDDYVIATGETHSVREFLDEAFSYVGLDWQNMSRSTRSITVRRKWICSSATRAKQKKIRLGSEDEFKDLVRLLVDADMEMVWGDVHMKSYNAAASNVQRSRTM